MVIVGSNDDKIVALSTLTGNKVWNYHISDDVGRASPLVSGSTVYIGAQDGTFYALDANTGDLRWQLNTWAVWGAPAVSGNTLYVGSDKSILYALNPATGATKWSATLGDRVRCTPSIKNGTVYVGADDYRVYAYNASTGALKWKTSAFPHKGIVRSSPAVWNGMVFVNTGETDPMGSHVYALDADTGETVWSHTMADYATSSPAIANGVLYTGSYDHQIYAFDARTGEKLWTSGYDEMQAGIPGSVAVLNGTVYIGSKDDKVYAFGL
jgi:eukaryotic-like serine/threonine-protein kinase